MRFFRQPLKSLGQVWGFADGKAFGNVLLSGLLIAGPILGIIGIIVAVSG
jgi:hypothetical protein